MAGAENTVAVLRGIPHQFRVDPDRVAVSPPSKSQPLTIRMPTVVKYWELTKVNFEECRFGSFDAISTKPIVQLLPSSGTFVGIRPFRSHRTMKLSDSLRLPLLPTEPSEMPQDVRILAGRPSPRMRI